jgi:hypothetical protein
VQEIVRTLQDAVMNDIHEFSSPSASPFPSAAPTHPPVRFTKASSSGRLPNGQIAMLVVAGVIGIVGLLLLALFVLTLIVTS